MLDVHEDPVSGISYIRLGLHRDREVAKALGATLRQERVRRGWTLRNLADAIGDVSEQYIGMVERGERKPSHDVFLRLLAALQLAPEVQPDGGITFWCSEGTQHVTTYLAPLSTLRGTGVTERSVARQAADVARLGQVVAVIARDQVALQSVFRHLGLDEAYNTHMELEEDGADWARGR